MLGLLLLGFIVLSLGFEGAMHGWRVLCLNGISLGFEGAMHGWRVLYLNGISLEFKIDGQGIPH